jgi:1,4-dihydroxy-2-naphthoate octaprenyltransferase
MNSASKWLLASRPKTLPAAAAPVVVGSAVAFWQYSFALIPALVTLLTALLLQVAANLANDVFDYYRGVDVPGRLGPIRVTASGLLSPRQVVIGLVGVLAAACILGGYLFVVAGWPILVIGLSAIIAALAYTGGPFPYGYHGLGDLFVFVFFGPVAVVGTYYIQALTVTWEAFWASIPIGLITIAILVVNNLRDIGTDGATGKRTLAVRLGVQGTRIEYLVCLILAYLSLIGMGVLQNMPIWIFLAYGTIPQAYILVRMVFTQAGRPLNRALAGTGQLDLLFGLLFSAGLVLGRIL